MLEKSNEDIIKYSGIENKEYINRRIERNKSKLIKKNIEKDELINRILNMDSVIAQLNQEEKETPTMENLAEDVTELKQDIKQILQLLEQLNQGADKKPKEEKKTVPKTYGGLPYTPPPSDII